MIQFRDQKTLNQSPPSSTSGERKITRNAIPSTALRRMNMAFIFMENPYN